MTPRTQARRLARPGRRIAAAAALVGLGLGLAAVPAAAVDPLTTAGDLDVVEQTVLVSWVEGVDEGPGTQRLLIDVRAVGRVEAGGQTQVLLVTPTEPTVTTGSDDVLKAVSAAASPEVIIEERWWPDLESFGGGGDEEVASAGATYPLTEDGIGVHGVVPAAQLTGWLSGLGYQLSPGDVEVIQRYASGGWSFTSVFVDIEPGTVNGGPPPIDVTFTSDQPVLPMVLASANTQALTTTTYVLASGRMDRSDPLRGNSQLLFSGPVSGGDYPALADWLAPFDGSAVLTKSTQTFPSPNRITEEVTFAPSEQGPFDAGTETRVVDRIILGLPAGIMLVAMGMILVAVLGIVASQMLQRRYQE